MTFLQPYHSYIYNTTTIYVPPDHTVHSICLFRSYSTNQRCQNDLVTNSIEEVTNTTFLGLELDNNITWKNHVGKILPKLCRACYTITTMYPISSLNTLQMIYFAYFHSILNYCIIFWGNSTESKKVFLAQKRIIRIMTGSKTRASCKTTLQIIGNTYTNFPIYYVLNEICTIEPGKIYF